MGAGRWGWLAGLAVVTLVLATAFFLGRPPAPPVERERPPGTDRPAPPGLHFRDFLLVGREQGEKRWELQVAAVEAPPEAEEVAFRVVRRGTVYRNGRPYLFLAADGGTYRPAQNAFVLRGNVVVSRPNGDLLRTSELRWDPTTRRATSDGPVEAKVEGIWFRADRLAVDVDAESVTASGRVELVREDGQRLMGETVVYSLADAAWEIRGPAELTLPTGGRDEPYVAPGLGGGLLTPAGGGKRP